jgi:F0F1-type ATP synthase assembly protein I
MAVSYGLIAAILVLGGAGYLLDRELGTSPWLLLAGLLAGMSIGFYGLRRLITSR